MTKAECLLLVILLNLMGLVGFLICRNRVLESELHYEIDRLREQVVKLGEAQLEVDERQNDLIGAIIRTEAMRGTFDKEK